MNLRLPVWAMELSQTTLFIKFLIIILSCVWVNCEFVA